MCYAFDSQGVRDEWLPAKLPAKLLQSDALVFTSFEPIADLTHGASSIQLPAHLSPHEGAQAQDAGHASAFIASLVDLHAPSAHHYDLLL